MALIRGHYEQRGSGWSYHRHNYCCHEYTSSVEVVAYVIVFALVLLAAIGWMLLRVLDAAARHATEIALVLLAVGLLAALVWAGMQVQAGLVQRRTTAYLSLCRRFASTGSLTGEELEQLRELAASLPVESFTRTLGEENVYFDFVATVLGDGEVDERERNIIAQLEKWFLLDRSYSHSVKLQALDGLLHALADQLASDAAAAVVAHVRAVGQRLNLDAEAVEERLRAWLDATAAPRVEAARESAREREYRLAAEVHRAASRTPISASVRLPTGETAWHEASPCKLGPETGKLLVTNRRLLFVSDGAISVPLPKILDVAADPNDGRVRVIVDDSKRAYEFVCGQPLVIMAQIERSLDELG